MKKIILTLILALMIGGLIFILTPSKATGDDLAHYLAGIVYYGNGGQGVGSGKRVYVYYNQTQYYGYDLTDNNSWYRWGFYNSLYVYKVRCTFSVGSQYYTGETIIDDTLTQSTRVDIAVYPGGAPPDGAGH
jgi:hypothetical protein